MDTKTLISNARIRERNFRVYVNQASEEFKLLLVEYDTTVVELSTKLEKSLETANALRKEMKVLAKERRALIRERGDLIRKIDQMREDRTDKNESHCPGE